AKEVLTHLEEDVQRQNTRLISPQSVYLSWSFMDNPRLLGTMITNSDAKALSLYLLILRNYDGNEDNKVTIDYENFKEYLEGAEEKDSAALRRDINRTLKKLDEEYKLINVTLKYADNAEVTLNDYEDPSKPYSIPKEKYIAIPHAYWTYRWSKTLPLKATVAYALNLGYSSLSRTPPTWFYSQEYLAQKHSFSTWFFSEGTNTLKELNLVEVEYDDIPTNPTDPRKANRYSPNKLYDPERLKDRFLAIENEHGKEKLQRARDLLAIIHEQSDANAAVALIKFEDKYGLDAIRQGKEVIESKKDDNPKKNIAYLLATIRNIGEKNNIVSEVAKND
ncbi:MAG: hypothetical protein ACI9CF_001592, partial [Candidatus Omnitrophota bacterium]